jgi:hypothetical protein
MPLSRCLPSVTTSHAAAIPLDVSRPYQRRMSKVACHGKPSVARCLACVDRTDRGAFRYDGMRRSGYARDCCDLATKRFMRGEKEEGLIGLLIVTCLEVSG